MKIVIVGGVAGGASCAARLRRLNENAEIIMVEKGPYVSYANCGLPYYVGGVIKKESSLLVASEKMFKLMFGIELIDWLVIVVYLPLQLRTETEQPGLGRLQLLAQLGHPRRVGEISGGHNCEPLTSNWCCHPVRRRFIRLCRELICREFSRCVPFPT